MTENLIDAIESILLATPALNKRQLSGAVATRGFVDLSTSEINSILYGHPSKFRWVPGSGHQRLWLVNSEGASRIGASENRGMRDVAKAIDLYPWQQRALEAWIGGGCRGVVEAVTGAGKTRLALAAMYRAIRMGRLVVIIVPTLDLVDQWASQVSEHLLPHYPQLRVGRRGGGTFESTEDNDVIIATVHSGAAFELLPNGAQGILIADECHHYGAETWQLALEEGFSERLGLTATYEREDLGVEKYLDPYFGGICYSIGYGEALADGVIAPFKLALIGVPFQAAERKAYEDASAQVSKYRTKLIEGFDVASDPFGEFMRDVQSLHNGSGMGARIAGFYLNAFQKRRAVLAGAQAKYAALSSLSSAARAAERSIVFAQTKDAARKAVQVLTGRGVRATVLDSDMDLAARKTVFAGFEDGTHELVAAPRLLDEGIDVPAADLAIVLASSRSRRQMIQRMGRVLRKKADDRVSRIAILYVEGTSEDPTVGAHEGFLDLLLDVAEEVRTFPSRGGFTEALAFLRPG